MTTEAFTPYTVAEAVYAAYYGKHAPVDEALLEEIQDWITAADDAAARRGVHRMISTAQLCEEWRRHVQSGS